MVKSKKVWSVTAGFVGAAGLAALATGANTVSASTTGTVNYKTGATTVWNSPSWNHVKRYVTFGDTVQLLGKTVDHNGATWYKVGDNQWIPELYLNVDGKTAQVEDQHQLPVRLLLAKRQQVKHRRVKRLLARRHLQRLQQPPKVLTSSSMLRMLVRL